MMRVGPIGVFALPAMLIGLGFTLRILLPVLPSLHTSGTERFAVTLLAGFFLEFVLSTIVLKLMIMTYYHIKNFFWNYVYFHFIVYGHMFLEKCTAVCLCTAQKMVPSSLWRFVPVVLRNALAYRMPPMRRVPMRQHPGGPLRSRIRLVREKRVSSFWNFWKLNRRWKCWLLKYPVHMFPSPASYRTLIQVISMQPPPFPWESNRKKCVQRG